MQNIQTLRRDNIWKFAVYLQAIPLRCRLGNVKRISVPYPSRYTNSWLNYCKHYEPSLLMEYDLDEGRLMSKYIHHAVLCALCYIGEGCLDIQVCPLIRRPFEGICIPEIPRISPVNSCYCWTNSYNSVWKLQRRYKTTISTNIEWLYALLLVYEWIGYSASSSL